MAHNSYTTCTHNLLDMQLATVYTQHLGLRPSGFGFIAISGKPLVPMIQLANYNGLEINGKCLIQGQVYGWLVYLHVQLSSNLMQCFVHGVEYDPHQQICPIAHWLYSQVPPHFGLIVRTIQLATFAWLSANLWPSHCHKATKTVEVAS